MTEALVVGREYRRKELHDRFGGSRQSGISSAPRHNMILLFSGASGEQYGYSDSFQPDGTFWYSGEGQSGDMQMTRGNLAIQKGASEGRTIHLFTTLTGAKDGHVRYEGEALYCGHHFRLGKDKSNQDRKVIVFQLALDQAPPQGEAPDLRTTTTRSRSRLWSVSLEKLRDECTQVLSREMVPEERLVLQRERSVAVKIYALRRAQGICEGCCNAAPFLGLDGRPFLEAHHIRRLADEGPDHPDWVVALCPNCHRRVHCGADGAEFNTSLMRKRQGGIHAP